MSESEEPLQPEAVDAVEAKAVETVVGLDADAALRLEGEEQRVCERWIRAERVSWVLTMLGIVPGAATGVMLGVRLGDPAWYWALLMVLGLVLLTSLLIWGTVWHPRAAYERTRYALNEKGVEIRQGVWWRKVISVPKARVQHTDVEQGPVLRRYGIAKLVIHTAGTEHATVNLYGLEYDDALRIRDHLIGRHVGSGDPS